MPTAEEQGFSGLELPFWHGLWAPKGTPSDIVTRLNRAVVSALADPVTRQRFADRGRKFRRASSRRPKRSLPTIAREIAKWWPILKAANIKGE